MDGKTIKEALAWVERETALRTKQSRMLSSGIQGEFLQSFSLMLHPHAILEIGTFTGYSTICLSRGLASGGIIDALEINDELEDIILAGYEKAGLINFPVSCSDIARLHIGDARELIPTLKIDYDLVYIDANKREYIEYYQMVFDKVKPNGYIIADNVLWSGKASMTAPPHDPQTRAIIEFDQMIRDDDRIEYATVPIRDGICIIHKLLDNSL